MHQLSIRKAKTCCRRRMKSLGTSTLETGNAFSSNRTIFNNISFRNDSNFRENQVVNAHFVWQECDADYYGNSNLV